MAVELKKGFDKERQEEGLGTTIFPHSLSLVTKFQFERVVIKLPVHLIFPLAQALLACNIQSTAAATFQIANEIVAR